MKMRCTSFVAQRAFSIRLISPVYFLFVEVVFETLVVAYVDLVFDVFAVEVDPQEQDVPVVGFDVAGGQDGSGLFQSHFVAIMQVNGRVVVPGAVTAFDQRGTIKGAQAGKGGYGQVWAFVEAHGPAILYLFKNGRRAFDDCDFIVHIGFPIAAV